VDAVVTTNTTPLHQYNNTAALHHQFTVIAAVCRGGDGNTAATEPPVG
jgi:hypothetical protein